MISIQSDSLISIILKEEIFINNFANYYLKTQSEIGNFLYIEASLGNVIIEKLNL